ncbi:MAG: hypothetical protein ACI9MB_004661 [Verrucomicrobiales bacterium]
MSRAKASENLNLIGRFRGWYAGLDPLGRQRFGVAVGLGIALVGLLVFLTTADAPWEGEAPKLLERSLREPGTKGYLKNLPTEYWSQVHLWQAAAINICLIALLLSTSYWWVRWAFAPKAEALPRIGRPISKLSIVFLLGALILGGCLRLPLMNRQIQHDEQDNLRRSIHGYTDVHEDGTEEWRPAGWNHAFHENRLANNPILLSITAKASLEIWRKFTGLPEDHFQLVPIRLPSLLAGLASIVLIWRILHWFGYRCAALFAAFFLAVHPTAIDFHVQARGYSLSMLFELIAIASIYLALRTLKWRYWILYGASIFLCLYSYLGAVYFAIGINLFLAIYLGRRIWRAKTRAAAWPQLVRCGIVNLIAALAFIQAAKPALAQADSYLHDKFAKSELHGEWVFCAWDHIVAGVILPTSTEWWDALPEEDRHITEYLIEHYIPEEPVLAVLTLVVSPLLLIFGTVRLIRGNRFATPLALGGLAAPVLAYLHSRLVTHLWLHTWYIIYALPVFIVLFAIGITSLSDFFKNKPLRPFFTLAIGTAYLILFSIITGSDAGKGSISRTIGKIEYVEFQRGKSRWRVFEDGKMTRELGKNIDSAAHP